MTKSILLMYSNYRPGEKHMNRLRNIAAGFEIRSAQSEEHAVSAAPQAEVIVGHRYLRQTLPHAQQLKFVQISGSGFDHLPWQELKDRRITLARTTFASKVIAQHAYVLAWALIRQLPQCLTAQARRQWDTGLYDTFLPWPRTALIFGLGSIGVCLSELLKSAGLTVWGVNTSGAQRGQCNGVFELNAWKEILPRTDMLFLTCPLNENTRNIIDAGVLASLPGHALVVNVAREGVLDTAALIQCLKDGKLGGAALDVFDRRPLTADDPLWQTPNLIITPYLAGRYVERAGDFERFVEEQLQRYVSDTELLNVIDWEEIC